jgi:hypothetical protein
MFRGASTPILTELGPILTIVIEISSPIRIRSLIFRESTSIPFSLCKSVIPERQPAAAEQYQDRTPVIILIPPSE